VLAYAPLALFVMCFAKFQLIQAIVFACISTRLTDHSSTTSSGRYSSTASSASAATIASSSVGVASAGPVDVLMIPSGTGIYLPFFAV